MNGRTVDPNSVQAQFATLNRDRDGLRRSATVAERERRLEEDLLRGLRATQAQLAQRIEAANATLGLETKRLQLLRAEEGRLKRVMAEEKREIVDITAELEGLDGEERGRKVRFVKEMDSLNEELDAAVRQYEERRLMRLLTEESVENVVCAKVNELASGGEDALPPEVSNKFVESLELMKEATSKLSNEVEMKKALEEEIRGLRAKMMQNQQLGEMELDDLEKMWEQAWENEEEGAGNVLGNSADPSGGKEVGPIHQQQQTMDMGLFYGNVHDQNHDEEEDMDVDAEVDMAGQMPPPGSIVMQ